MDREQLVQIFEAVKVLPLRPTDKIVVKYGGYLTSEQRNNMQEILEKEFDGHRVVILEGGLDIEIVRPE